MSEECKQILNIPSGQFYVAYTRRCSRAATKNGYCYQHPRVFSNQKPTYKELKLLLVDAKFLIVALKPDSHFIPTPPAQIDKMVNRINKALEKNNA